MQPYIEDICLIILVLQGFLITWYEYGVYKIHMDRFQERKTWRLAKQKLQLKKSVSDAELKGSYANLDPTSPVPETAMKESVIPVDMLESNVGEETIPQK